MTLKLYAHPFSSYCQKVLIALYENDIAFEWRVLTPDDAATDAEFTALWPIRRMPLLRDGERTVIESSIIIEYLDRHYPGAAPLIPFDVDTALEARAMDRCFDLYVQTPVQKIVFDSLRPAADRDPSGVNISQALVMAKEQTWGPEAQYIFDFVAASKKGVCAMRKRGISIGNSQPELEDED